MLRTECTIVEQVCDEQQDEVVHPQRLGSWFAKATGLLEWHSPAPLPYGMTRAFLCGQPASLGFVSSLHFTVMGASSPGGLVCCMGSHLEDRRCCWCMFRSSFTDRILKPVSIHSLLEV